MAYLTAATHGLEQEAQDLAESLPEGQQLPDVLPGAQLLQPPVPVSQQESNWPLLTTTKGFFESAMLARQQATGAAGGSLAAAAASAELDEGGDGWGEDDIGEWRDLRIHMYLYIIIVGRISLATCVHECW